MTPRVAIIANIGGRQIDLYRAMTMASNSDWRALQAQTGRGPFMVAKRSRIFQTMGELAKSGALDDPENDTAGFHEGHFIEVITDLIFLARRAQGESTLTWQQVSDETSFMEALAAFGAAAQQVAEETEEEADPTAKKDSAPAAATVASPRKTASSRTSKRQSAPVSSS